MKNTINFPLLLAVSFLMLSGCKKSDIAANKIAVPAPTISTIKPSTGGAGVQVTIRGLNFAASVNNNTVKFNGDPATVVLATDTMLVVTAPPLGSTGAVSVTTSAGTGTGPVFTYLF